MFFLGYNFLIGVLSNFSKIVSVDKNTAPPSTDSGENGQNSADSSNQKESSLTSQQSNYMSSVIVTLVLKPATFKVVIKISQVYFKDPVAPR